MVNFWIDRPTRDIAIAAARIIIRDQNWLVGELEEVRSVVREEFEDNPEGLRFFDQAVIDHEVAVFYVYPGANRSKRT